MNRGLAVRLLIALVWVIAMGRAAGVFELGLAGLDERETVVIMAGLAVIFALDVWGWVRRDRG